MTSEPVSTDPLDSPGGPGPAVDASVRSARRWLPLVLALALCASSAVIASQRRLATWDDAYIYARSVRNVLEGRGWSFNPERPVDLCTSPLYFGMLLGASALAGSADRVPDVAAVLYGLTLGSTATLIFLVLIRGVGPAMAFLAAFGFLHHQYVQFLNGIETLLLLTCCLAALWTYEQGKHVRAALLLAAAVLARPDALILAALVTMHFVAVRRRLPGMAIAAAFVLPLAGWAVLHYAQFGTVLTGTLAAKMAQGHTGLWTPFERGLHVSFAADRPVPLVQAYEWAKTLAIGGVLVALVRRDVPVLLLALFAAVHFEAYTRLGVPYYHWYYGPEYLAGWVLIAVCLSVGYRLASWLGYPRTATILTVASCAAMAAFVVRIGDLRNRHPYTFVAESLNQGYFHLADRIRPLLEPGDRLLVAEVGTLGWALPDQVIVDTVGLVGSVTADELRQGQFNAWLSRVETAGPDYVLVLDRFVTMMFTGSLAVHQRFDELFEPALQLDPPPGDVGGAFRATLYRRREAPRPDGPGRSMPLLPLITADQLKPPEVAITYVADRGRVHPMLFEHPINQVSVDVTVSKRYLLFGHGLRPGVHDLSDGAQFMIRVESEHGVTPVYDVSVRPRDVPGDRQFRHAFVDLEPWAGKNVRLLFLTAPAGTLDFDQGGWLSPRLADSPEG
jgi:hypothetical protein